ncbi:MAG TPA: peptide chain release factor 1 [Chitinivibrionales bacterium]|nr:peptide chain release factor 1 [Chitinivibrionales bacterium]
MIDKIQELIARQKELETELSSPAIISNPSLLEKLGREYNGLKKNMPEFQKYLAMIKTLSDNKELLATESDPGIREMAKEEKEHIEKELPSLEQTIKYLLVPKDPNDYKNAIMEIRAGTGGIEAGIFAADLYRMYSHFIENKGWGLEVLSSSYGDIGAVKEIIFMVSGDEAYGTLKFESGVHRVQRVPQTEAQGRIHTSAASVAVFPEADDIEVNIDPSEIRIDVFRAGGKGGQHVNKTESAVRIVHLETGLTVSCQDEKSQLKNKAKAMKILSSRLYDLRQSEKQAKESASRKSMVGSGDRSEKIRTYNFPQNRVSDHRINLTLYKLDAVMNGDLRDLITALAAADLNERIRQSGTSGNGT